MTRRLSAEVIGSLLLLTTVVGFGIMAENLAGGKVAIALLGKTIPTGAIPAALILIPGPVSGTHFNPSATIARTQPIHSASLGVSLEGQG
jgi:glycerol uptake facilitator-like aquaporin